MVVNDVRVIPLAYQDQAKNVLSSYRYTLNRGHFHDIPDLAIVFTIETAPVSTLFVDE
jgi:hypothetical protein